MPSRVVEAVVEGAMSFQMDSGTVKILPRVSVTRLTLTPSLMRRAREAGMPVGEMNLGVWLVMQAEEAKLLREEVARLRAENASLMEELDDGD